MNKSINQFLENNKNWAKNKIEKKPDYFQNLAKGQQPPILWVGCSDSRVPATQILGAEPGDLFVHRNIANLALESDINFLSVLEYSVNVLKVKHIVVCGHYGCGGVKAAMEGKPIGKIDAWLKNISLTFDKYKAEIDAIDDAEEKYKRCVEINVQAQVDALAENEIVKQARQSNQPLDIHGWIYALDTGLISACL